MNILISLNRLLTPCLQLSLGFAFILTFSIYTDDAFGDHKNKSDSIIIDQRITKEKSFLDGYSARASEGLIQAVIEIPAGSVDKWEVDKQDGSLRWEVRDGKFRKVRYLGYVGNYGMIPRTLLSKKSGGDGDPLDILVLGPSLERGSIVRARLIGMLITIDRGESDDKLIAVMPDGEFSNVQSISDLRKKFPGVTEIIEIWFQNYKGPGKVQTKDYVEADEAEKRLQTAIDDYKRH